MAFSVKPVPSAKEGLVSIRMTRELHSRLKEAARDSGLSMNAPLVQMMEHCLPDIENKAEDQCERETHAHADKIALWCKYQLLPRRKLA